MKDLRLQQQDARESGERKAALGRVADSSDTSHQAHSTNTAGASHKPQKPLVWARARFSTLCSGKLTY
ncbi:hypothetical protein PCANC_03512 [Puccinia coronata f. sp. avenae]|uniref:Uncharacterized protein n=1 Tax=Puccinia coronata f. sp. avenae TaxID=200324 RepID=A0A2N5VZY0_9BASI|nr:hypothetical protein PCANC_13765 [Puccinia coronata f. sp. avenae]PLW55574.1 hypothetical protein PCANC_03512 [Puccinia coronata f. sp. avenae]